MIKKTLRNNRGMDKNSTSVHTHTIDGHPIWYSEEECIHCSYSKHTHDIYEPREWYHKKFCPDCSSRSLLSKIKTFFTREKTND